MVGGYAKYWKDADDEFTTGLIAGIEQRLTRRLVFVTDYFQGSGEGYGVSPGFVFYAKDEGSNLPIYLAYQFDNDDRANDLLLLEIGYMFQLFGRP
jgi:hypothetical protein